MKNKEVRWTIERYPRIELVLHHAPHHPGVDLWTDINIYTAYKNEAETKGAFECAIMNAKLKPKINPDQDYFSIIVNLVHQNTSRQAGNIKIPTTKNTICTPISYSYLIGDHLCGHQEPS